MNNRIPKAFSIIVLAMSISVIGPDHAMAKGKKQTGVSSGASLNSSARSRSSLRSTSNSRRSSMHEYGHLTNYRDVNNIDLWVGATTTAPGNSPARSRSSARSTSNSLRSNNKSHNLSIATTEVFELNTLNANVPRRPAFNQPEQLPSSISLK
jgi:hypothetical protein